MNKDYLKSSSAEYKAGYDHGRTSMMKEVLIALFFVALVVVVFN